MRNLYSNKWQVVGLIIDNSRTESETEIDIEHHLRMYLDLRIGIVHKGRHMGNV